MKKFAVSLITAALLTASLFSTAAFAAEFTPSTENKGAPAIQTTTDANGNTAAAIITDKDGNEVAGVPAGELTVTSQSQAAQADPEIRQKLEEAYSQLLGAETLDQVAQEITNRLPAGVDKKDLVIRDLFDVSVSGAYADHLAKEGNTISIRFGIGLNPEDFLLVMHNYEGDKWEVIPDERVERHADGSVSVVFDSLSPIAFVVEQSAVAVNTDGPVSPQTGDTDFGGWGVGAAVMAGAAVVCFAKARKRD